MVDFELVPTRRDRNVSLVTAKLQVSERLQGAVDELGDHDGCLLPQWPLHIALGLLERTPATPAPKETKKQRKQRRKALKHGLVLHNDEREREVDACFETLGRVLMWGAPLSVQPHALKELADIVPLNARRAIDKSFAELSDDQTAAADADGSVHLRTSEQLAAIELGWDERSWDLCIPTAACRKVWAELSPEEQQAATVLGYSERLWDTEWGPARIEPRQTGGGAGGGIGAEGSKADEDDDDPQDILADILQDSEEEEEAAEQETDAAPEAKRLRGTAGHKVQMMQ